MSVTPVVYDTGGGLLDFLNPFSNLAPLYAAQQQQTTDTLVRIALTAGGILISIAAIGMIASEQGQGILANALKGAVEGGKK